MPQFECEGIDRNGRELKQRVDAADQHGARDQLRSQGIFCTSIKQIEPTVGSSISPSTPTSIPRDPVALDALLLELLRDNRKIEAVKVYREVMGSDLLTAKNYVDALPQRNIGQQIGTATHSSTSTFSSPDHEGLEQQVLTLLRTNQRIQAVKVYRDATKCDLRSAMTDVNALAQRHGIKPSGCAIRTAAVLVVIGIVTAAAAATVLAVGG